MTLEQMDNVVQAYCELIAEGDGALCANCRIKDLCDKCAGEFDRYPFILKQAYDIVGTTPTDWCCQGCLYDDCGLEQFPCVKCKANTLHSDPNYEMTPYLWTPIGEPKPVHKIETEPATTPPTAVNHPTHYNQGGIECIDAMESAFGKEAVANFCIVNAFKYIWRTEHKNGIQDIDKAIWYLNKYKELVASE